MVNRFSPLEFHGIPSNQNNFAAGILKLSRVVTARSSKQFVNFRPFSDSLESVLHQLKQKCLESTIMQTYQKSRSQLLPFFAFFLVQNTSRSYKTFVLTESFV